MASLPSFSSDSSEDASVERVEDTPLTSPMKAIHKDRKETLAKAAVRGVHELSMRNFLFWQMGTFCYDVSKSCVKTKCKCMMYARGYLTDEDVDSCVSSCVQFATKEWSEQTTILIEWHKYTEVSRRLTKDKRLYVLPGTSQQICKHALCKLLCIGYQKWKNIVKMAKEKRIPVHGLKLKSIGNKRNLEMEGILFSFFAYLEGLATPRATLVIRDYVRGEKFVNTTLKFDDDELMELPPNLSKRSLYARLVEERGWKFIYSSNSKVIEKTCLDGKEQDVPSWSAFTNFWKKNYPKLVIAKPREDICGDCWTFANRHKLLSKRKKFVDDACSSSSESSENEEDKEGDKSEEDEATEEIEIMMENEELVIEASKHVEMAQIQRKLFQKLKASAVATALLPPEERVVTFVADYSQNMYIPNFAMEQPGETYYYSPLNVSVFGVVNCCVDPHKLSALIYTEDQGKKGGNNVVSLLMYELKRQGLDTPSKPYKELNFVFDNCGGQNKNRMVLRNLIYIVKKKIATVVRAVFLIRGHTKNDCDRLFNIMKKQYRRTNTYTPQDLLAAVRHELVDPIAVPDNTFQDYDAHLNTYISVLPGGMTNINHVFTVDANKENGNTIYLQTHEGAAETKVLSVKKDYRDKDDDFWLQLPEPETIPPPGMQDIKWKELFDKWGPIIPPEKKSEFRFYHEDPGPERRKQVKQQQDKAKKQRAERSRTAQQKKGLQEQPEKKKAASNKKQKTTQSGII
jgi:hypothetical protein